MVKKVFVTGAGGFIGSHLVETLLRLGYDVKAFVQYRSSGTRGWLEECPQEISSNLEVVLGDIRDYGCVENAMKNCTSVLHLAALISIPYSYLSPESYVDTNVRGTLNVLQAARKLNVDKVVCTSTSEVYGSAQYVPIDERHPLVGQSPYSATKIAADQLAISFFSSFSIPIIILRPFNTFGPRQSTRAIIPNIISQIQTKRGEIMLGNLSPTRDFTFVKDTVAGFLAALESQGAIGGVFNIGSGFELSIGDLVRLISEHMNIEVTVVEDGQRIRPLNSEVTRLWADVTRAKEVLGWIPKFSGMSGFSRGLSETIDWFTKNLDSEIYNRDTYRV